MVRAECRPLHLASVRRARYSEALREHSAPTSVICGTSSSQGRADASAPRLAVSSRRLLAGDGVKGRRWVDQVSEYCPSSVSVFQSMMTPRLDIDLHFRDLLQHHVPITVASASFGEVLQIGSGPRFIEKLKMGVVLPKVHPGERLHWPTGGEGTGILPDAVVPYPSFAPFCMTSSIWSTQS